MNLRQFWWSVFKEYFKFAPFCCLWVAYYSLALQLPLTRRGRVRYINTFVRRFTFVQRFEERHYGALIQAMREAYTVVPKHRYKDLTQPAPPLPI